MVAIIMRNYNTHIRRIKEPRTRGIDSSVMINKRRRYHAFQRWGGSTVYSNICVCKTRLYPLQYAPNLDFIFRGKW